MFSAKITQNRGFEIVFFKIFLFAEGIIMASGRSLVRYLEYPVLYILYTLHMIIDIMYNVYNI